MLVNYGVTFCLLSLYCSSVMARPGPYYPRQFTNTTSPPSIKPSGHIPTSPTTSAVTLPPPTSLRNSSPASVSSFSSVSTSPSSSFTPTSSISSTIDLIITQTSLTNTTSQVSTTAPIVPSTTSPSNSSTATPTAGSNSTTSASTDCQPITTSNWFGSICISYCAVTTSFVFDPSTTQTITQFVTFAGNTTALNTTTRVPQSTQTLPPQPCFTPTVFVTSPFETQTGTGAVTSPPPAPITSVEGTTTVSYITSKTTVVSYVTSKSVGFGDSSVKVKQSVTPTILQPPKSIPTQKPQSQVDSTSSDVNTLHHPPTQVMTPSPPHTQGRIPSQGPVQTQGNPSARPSQFIAPGTTTLGPPPPSGPTQTVVNGVTVSVGSSIVVIDSSTFTVGSGETPITTIVGGQPFSIGPSGVGIGSTTLHLGNGPNPTPDPTPNPPTTTQIATIGSVTVTEIGSTVIIGSQTFTLGPSATPTTIVINSQTFSIGPGGVGTPSTTLFIPPPQTTQVFTAAGVSFSEIGSSIVIIGSDTITLGAQPTPTTTTIDGVAISIGPGGVGIGGSTTITAPPIPAPTTETITAGGITFSEIGSTIVVIGGTTFTIGPSAKPTTDIFNSVTISIGPGGVGFPSTTVSYDGSPSATSTASASGGLTITSAGVSSRKELRSGSGLFGLVFSLCIALWVALG